MIFYLIEPEVLRDFQWTSDPQIEYTMQSNLKADPSIARQFIGTYSGLTKIFPEFRWDLSPEPFAVDLFDSRFRQWFTSAETAPRDILFLID